ncbi:hypothetical protein [Fluviispira multicolorata]|uniref:Uncharacterized protein n=1 Tax=Fluviispira multicolorata TaxID=2654512 RepID=A0A833JAB2_9BACT|nr:hypothetical protein [Fluviispira multicolorata]KAB8027964.1 hypothetical protein GCL57_12990 [Fluviispira multicolorata]
MSKKIEFENHFSARVLEIFFPEGYHVHSNEDILNLKNLWIANLKSWHSPYTCLIDFRDFDIKPELIPAFENTLKFFKNFFMRKIIGFYEDELKKPHVKIEMIFGYENAIKQTGLARGRGIQKVKGDLRSSIQIDNDFNAHVMEITFAEHVDFSNNADIQILKSKLQNILMMWHTPYSIMFNCVNCTFSPETHSEFVKVERFLKGFFCKAIIGYAPKEAKETYPFITFRSRHLAAASLENSGIDSGEIANCSTRKIGT